MAASLGNVHCTKLLLSYGADVRVQLGTARSTPLHLAAEEGSAECARLLVNAGAACEAKNSRGQTPMHMATLAQSVETIDVLIKAGAEVNAADNDGRTPLHAAVAKALRCNELVRTLIQVCKLSEQTRSAKFLSIKKNYKKIMTILTLFLVSFNYVKHNIFLQ